MQSYRLTWLPFMPAPETRETPEQTAAAELSAGLRGLRLPLTPTLCVVPNMDESYEIEFADGDYRVRGGERGVLYGVYRLLMALAAGELPPLGVQKPAYALRMLDCWDNADGSVERGYAGRSLFFDGGAPCYDAERLRLLGRMLASVGVNVLCVNNVNVTPPCDRLIDEWLPEAARLAALFRPYGIRLMFSVDYSSPISHGLSTADPLDTDVQSWWEERVKAVYGAIPDLAGFLVKADSEHRPGPFTYGRDHAQGANMLARALAPYGGILVWRCFVYNCRQDWRDGQTDRPMASYQHYACLDGSFDNNVVLQIKHGPFDFQVREPISPLLYAAPKTNKALEVQLTQEYTGHQIDLYAMAGMWKEIFDELPPENIMAVTAVSNLGMDANWTGHDFAQLNLFAFGCMAWNPRFDPRETTRRWCRLSYALPPEAEERLLSILEGSRETYEMYTAPLGVCWMVNPQAHYGPSPDGYEYSHWGTYHRADRDAVGIDRTANGTGYTLQYPEAIRARFDKPEKCPDRLLLFFHRLPYNYVMGDGRTLVQRIYDDHFEGVQRVEAMAAALETLPLTEAVHQNVCKRMEMQLENAREWCDVINSFFYRLSGVKDAHGRTIYP